MGAGETRLFLTNGQVVSIYTDASPVGSPVRCSTMGTAGTTSPYDFTVESPCCIRDILTTTTTTGVLEVFANGVRSGRSFPTDQRWVVANNRAPNIPRICFTPGRKYRFVPSLATS